MRSTKGTAPAAPRRGKAALAAAVLSLAAAQHAVGQNMFPYVEDMGSDSDAYVPTDLNLADDGPAFDASRPPGFNPLPGDPSLPDWGEQRTPYVGAPASGFIGAVEEVRNSWFGVQTGDDSSNYGLLNFGDMGTWYENRWGPLSRVGRDAANATFFPGTTIHSTQDIWLDPNLPASVPGAPTAFSLENTLANNDAQGYGIPAVFRVEVLPAPGGGGGTVWRIADGVNATIATVPAGQWTRWEIEPSRGADGVIHWEYRVIGHDINGEYANLLGSTTHRDVYGGSQGTFDDIGGPWLSVFYGATQTVPYLIIDNVGWTNGLVDIGSSDRALPIPEPAGVAGALGVAGILFTRRRRTC